jgi:hypothetical protein
MRISKERLEYYALCAEIIGAAAVILSVIYLAIQINENTTELQNQGYYNALMMAQRPLEIEVASPELSALVVRGYADPELLSPAEWERFSKHQFIFFNGWEYLYYSDQTESIPKNLWIGADAYFRGLIQTHHGLRRFWSEFQEAYAEPFNAYVDAVYAEYPEPPKGVVDEGG